MPQYIDSYYLVENRKPKIIYNFIKKFSEKFSENTNEYYITDFINTTNNIVFYSTEDLFKFLEQNPNYEYSVYWNNEVESVIKQFNVHFTNDGNMILGIAIEGNEPNSINSVRLFNEIKNYLNSKIACITIEESPPISTIDFINFCNERYKPPDNYGLSK
jgi:hypothetical protein